MTADLRNYLVRLHKCLPDSQRPDLAVTNVGDVVRCCSYLNTDAEIASACSLVFDDKNGLVAFLRKCAALDKYFASKIKILEFLPTFIEKARKSILKYAVDIKNVCLLIFNCDKKVKIRSAIFDILAKLFELCAGSEVGQELDTPALIEKLFLELAQQSKLTPTVQQGIYRLLGVVVETFPEYVGHCSDRILLVYFGQLKKQMTSKTKAPDKLIIEGCFDGLTSLLNTFHRSLDEDESKQLFQFANMSIKYVEDYTRYSIPRSGLQLFSKHSSLFPKHLYANHEVVYSNLCLWLKLPNREMNKLTYLALEALFRQVASIFCEEISSGSNRDAVRSKFQFFVDKFNWIVNTYNENPNLRWIAVAIKGYGFFAAPCKLLMGIDEVKVMFVEVLRHCEIIFFSESESIDSKIQHLPSFVESLASIISQLDQISEVFLLSLENLLVYLIEHFPLLLAVHHFLCYNAIIKLLVNIYPKGASFRPFIAKIVYQGLLRTCSHAVLSQVDAAVSAPADTETFDEKETKNVTYKNYMDLWSHLLDAVQQKDLNLLGIPLAERQAVTEILYDEIVSSVLSILSKLNFSVAKPSDASEAASSSFLPMSDPVAGLHAANPKDLQIFVNVVEFCKHLLLEKNTDLFKKWTYKFGYEVIYLSSKYPLVSGFYKLLAVCFKICSRSYYFKDINSEENRNGSLDADEKTTCFVLFDKYLNEVVARLQQYKDDLLASCLQLVLSAPTEIVAKNVLTIVPAVSAAFRLGPSYIPIAQEALMALEAWNLNLPSHVLAPLHNQILPLLNTFLKSAASVDGPTNVNLFPAKKGTRKSSGKVPLRLSKGKRGSSDSLPQIVRLKLRIVELLGHLGSDVSQRLIGRTEQSATASGIAWDLNKHLKFAVPFADMKPEVYLDVFLPKVVELASSSSDRQTKAAACELLHALVLFMLGSQTSKSADMQSKLPMTSLYEKILPAMLRLACDVDSFVRQLFEPLLMQLIHWFSSTKSNDGQVTDVLLQALMDGVGSPTDSALRDLSARCIKEFLVWSMKQSVPKKSRKDVSVNQHVKFLLKALYGLALNPDPFLRLGAALIFNNIFAVFREEDDLVQVFIFELLYYFVESLAIAQKDDKHLGTREQCKQALDHILRILTQKAKALNSKDACRRIPAKCSAANLPSAVIWLLQQCGRPESDCRHYCMTLVSELIPYLKDKPSTHQYFQHILKDSGPKFFIEKFEGTNRLQSERQYLYASPTLKEQLSKGFSLPLVLSWFDVLQAALDCYIWAFGNKDLSPADVFLENLPSVVLRSVRYFLTDLALCSLSSVASATSLSGSQGIYFSPGEITQYNYAKCTVIIRVMDFVECIAASSSTNSQITDFIEELFAKNSFWIVFSHCVLRPLSIGFEMSDLEVMENLPKRTASILTSLKRSLGNDHFQNLTAVIGGKIRDQDSWNAFVQLPTIGHMEEDFFSLTSLSHLVAGYDLLNSREMLVPCMLTAGLDVGDLAERCFDAVQRLCTVDRGGTACAVQLTGPRLSLAQKFLILSFGLGLSVDVLVKILMDASSLYSIKGHSEISMGSHLMVTFEREIALHLIHLCPRSVPRLMEWAAMQPIILANILFRLLDHLAIDRNLRKSWGAEVTKAILTNWEKLRFWWQEKSSEEMKKLTLRLFNKILVIDSTVVMAPGSGNNAAFLQVFDMYLTFLVAKDLNLQIKGHVLDVLPFFLGISEEYLNRLREHLVKLFSHHFPLKSSELSVGSVKYQEYVSMFKKLLSALRRTGSLMLLEIISELICTEPRHACEEEFGAALTSFMKRLPVENHITAVQIPLEIFWNEAQSTDVRRWALDRIAVPLLRNTNKVALLDFFASNIGKIMSVLREKSCRGFGNQLSAQLVSKLGCFELMEVLYSLGSVHDLHTMQSRVNSAFCDGNPKTGKELTQEITRAGHSAKKEGTGDEGAAVGKLRRLYRCAAYNALVAVISCTQTEMKFYVGFLFSENVAKGEFLWDNLIDNSKAYSFEMELSAPLEKRKQLVSIRQEMRELRAGDHADGDGSSYDLSIHFLTTQNLEASSLSDDVSQFDFTSSSKMSFSVTDNNPRVKEESDKEMKPLLLPVYVEMELDEINRHECMASLNALLEHLDAVVNKLGQSGDAAEMPPWMANLHKKMMDPSTQRNVRLFIGKLVVNNENVFKPCAKHWLYPLMQLIIGGAAGSTMNYFITDVLVAMLSWHKTAIPEDTMTDRSAASRLLEFLMRNAAHPTKDILRHNLELIKTLVECWKDRLEIPTKVIYDRFCNADPDKLDNVVGIQLLGIVLSKNLPPFSASTAGGLSEEAFLKSFARNLGFKYKDVYHSAAEVAGMCLKYLAEKDKSNEFPFHALVKDHLSHLASSQLDHFINCLHAIRASFPPIVDSFWKKILFILPQLHGVILVYALEILLSRLESIPSVYRELKSIDFCLILNNGNEGVQTICLQIYNKILRHMDVEQVSELLPVILPFASQPGNAKGRSATFEMLSWTYDNFTDEGTPNAKKVVSDAKSALIQCLADEDFAIRLKALNFWGHESRMPASTLERATELIRTLYLPISEHHFLSYATFLLMELTSKSPDYNRHMFEHPLSDCKFEDYNINSSWRAQHSTMLPLFLETQAPSSLSTEASRDPPEDPSPSGSRQIRATQENLQFTPTQNQDLSRPYNWLTQNTLDASFSTFGADEGESAPSSLMFNRRSGQGRWRKPAGADFGKRRLKMDETDNSASTDAQDDLDLVRLRRRFFKDRNQNNEVFARMNARIKQNREVKMRERKLAREAIVTVYRQYRKGDLPDIQISYASIIAPLQALAQRDSSVAKILFASLFTSILKEASRQKNQDEFGAVVQATLTSLNAVLEKTAAYNQSFISAVQEICYSNDLLKINAENLTSASRMSFQQNLGILLLERAVLEDADQDKPRPSKIPRLMKPKSTADNKQLWMKLAELHKSLNNYDVVNGIFMHEMAAEPELREALEAEAQGDYYSALRSYQKVFSSESQIHRRDDVTLDADLWNDCTLQCFEKLNNWEKLSSLALGNIDENHQPDISAVWEDMTSQEQYLPYWIRGKLKLVLRGAKEQPFIDFLDCALNDVGHPERRQLLEGRFSEELALLSIVQKDYDRADHYRSACINSFLEDWSALSDLVPVHQRAHLRSLQKLVEMGDFLGAIREASTNFEGRLGKLLNTWEKSSVDRFTDVGVLNDIYMNRNVYLKHFEARVAQQPESQQENAWTLLQQHGIRNQLSLILTCVEAAGCQNNVTVALAHLKDSYKLLERLDDPVLQSRWYHTYCRTHQLNAKRQDGSKRISTLFNVWKNLDKDYARETTQESAGLKSENLLLQSRNADLLAGFLNEDGLLLDRLTDDQIGDFQQRIGCDANDTRQTKAALTRYGYGKLHESVSLQYDPGREMDEMASAHLHLAKFCDRSLRDSEGKSQAIPPKELASALLSNLLSAMKFGSKEATRLFPRLLQLVEAHPDESETFADKVSEIPCWMFIPWIAQLVALLDKPQAAAIQGLVLRIAQEYPNALIYPFNVSRKGYSFASSQEGHQRESFVKRIQTILSELWLVEQFTRALEQLANPLGTFTDAVVEIAQSLKTDKKKCREIYKTMYDALFVQPFEANTVVPHGQFRKSFAKLMKKTFHEHFGSDGAALDAMGSQSLNNALKAITVKAGTYFQHPKLLKEYTEWLSEFRQSSHSMELEIPGQYGKFRKPMPEYHTKVARFHPNVLTLESIRRPKRIVMYGDNNKEYKFLVKAGEDLRGDQRIEQLFVLMNEVYARDPACRSRQLEMVTYEVVPLNEVLGLLEWVPNAEPLREFTESGLTEAERTDLERAVAVMYEWISAPSKGVKGNIPEITYEMAYKAYDRKASVAKFEEVALLSPRSMLRNAFFRMSASTEAFFTLRNHFVVSYAVASVSQYILGIGDRHLSNFMVSHDTGSIVTIDFGHAFGSATSFLSVPELMPMRLTPQLLDLMGPMREHGLFERTMVHALRALRDNAEILINTMDVFISEPSLDWINFARKQFAVIGKQGSENDLDWYPRQRVDFAKRKLSGDNSTAIMLDELELGQKRKKAFQYFKKVCAGEKDTVRARLAAKRLSVEKQVSCLLDHATDPHILAKTFVGWRAFL